MSQEESRDHSKVKDFLGKSELIEKLIKMLEKYRNMVETCFGNLALFERARHSAFEQFLNKDRDISLQSERTSMSEVIAIYTDTILRKGGMKNLAESMQEEYLKQIV